jgi:hypothetical protein
MNKPPSKIDGAQVLYWAWSGDLPFGWIGTDTNPKVVAIFGLVIAQYDNSSVIYRFSCTKNWETEQDADYTSVQEAMDQLPEQYREVSVEWKRY